MALKYLDLASYQNLNVMRVKYRMIESNPKLFSKNYGVSEIRENINIEASLLSHHLSKMKSVGILESYRNGRNIYYRLALPEITKVLECIYDCELKL